MTDTDNLDPFKSNSYFEQEWPKGTLFNKEQTIYIDEIKNQTKESENTYANILQNYYIYKSIEPQTDSILKSTSFYIPNPELFKILEVFKPLDQGHDFYTSQRNEKNENWTLPSYYVYNNTKFDNYNQIQANTSFGGGLNIFGLLYIEQDNYDILKSSNENFDINSLLNLINNNQDSISNFKSKYGLTLYVKKDLSEVIKEKPTDINNEYAEILLVSLYTSDIYNNGMHSLWNFIKPNYIYALQLSKDANNKKIFNGYKLYKCDNVVPELHISIKNIIEQYVNNNSDLTSLINVKGNQLYRALEKKIQDKNKLIDEINNIIINNNDYKINLQRGYTLVFTDFKTEDNSQLDYPKTIKDFLVTYLLKYYYSKLSPEITENYKPLIKNNENIKNNEINNIDNTDNTDNIYKIPVSIIDANSSPSESSLINSLRNMDSYDEFLDYPYKYSIVSINVDGSGLGGQISPSYHPPELSIYMTIFDSNNTFIGFIYRICFLKKINSNVLNSKSNIEVDMHFCFFNINIINFENITGENIDDIKNISSQMTDYILKNTKIDENMVLRTNIPSNPQGKAWYKYTLVSDAPSVKDLNTAVKYIDKYIKINRDNIQIGQKSNNTVQTIINNFQNITDVFSALGSSIYNSITLNAESKDPNGLNNLISTAIKLYWSDGILQEIYKNINIFVRIFIVRNKYIGDNSRATDTLYYNKEAVIDPIQISNDENTLSTAKLVNVSSILASPGSAERYVYVAPYLTNENKYITPITSSQNELNELQQLKLKQDSTTNLIKKKRKAEQTIEFVERITRSRAKGGAIDISQPFIPQLFKKESPVSTISSSSSLISSTPTISTLLNKTPSSITSTNTSTSIQDKTVGTSNEQYLNNTIKYLKNLSESISYINTTFIDTYQNQHMNDEIIKLYLKNVKNNISDFSYGLKIEDIISDINKCINDQNISYCLDTINKYNSILKDFSKIQSLISSANDIEQEQDENEEVSVSSQVIASQQGGTITKSTVEKITTKMINLFYFTENRMDILNQCQNELTDKSLIEKFNYYHGIILKLYDYLNGYINDVYSIEDYNIDGLSSFIGIYSFYMYFTIIFNELIDNKLTQNTVENKLVNFYKGNQLSNWIENNFDENPNLFDSQPLINYYRVIHDNIKILNFNSYINFDNENGIDNILNDININTNNQIFIKPIRGKTNKFQIITALKSLYYLLDDNFIVNFMNNTNIDFNIVNTDKFMEILYDNSLYGLLVDKKFKYYIDNNELKDSITNLLEAKKSENKSSSNMEISESGGTIKNKRKYKNHKFTKNKKNNNTRKNKKKTIKNKNNKKIKRNTIRHK